MSLATILISTHAERPTIEYSIRSALQQTVFDIDIFIVGDGCPDSTRRIVERLSANDSRIRFFDFPKGQRHGEAHRDTALAHSEARVVTYLSDDDLLFPDAVAVALECLREANFMAPRPCFIIGDGSPHLYDGDITSTWWQEALKNTKRNFIPMSGTSHTMALYRSLEIGWSPAPPDLWCDLHMWRKFMRRKDFRPVMATHPTSIILPAPFRKDQEPSIRASELAKWFPTLTDPSARSALERRLLAERQDAASAHVVAFEEAEARGRASNEHALRLQSEIAEGHAAWTRRGHEIERLEAVGASLHVQLEDVTRSLSSELAESRQQARSLECHVARLEGELDLLRHSLVWRTRDALYANPVVRRAYGVVKKLFRRTKAGDFR